MLSQVRFALAAFGEDLAGRGALAVLALAPSPEAGRRLSRAKIAAALRRAGRQRNIEESAERISAALRARTWRPIPVWWAPTPPRCARWSP
jgi:hypothetical protein